MRADDFEFDGQCLHDLGFVVYNLEDSRGLNEEDAESFITFNKVSHHGGKRFSLTSAIYEECIVAEFGICKDPDMYFGDDVYITNEEYRAMAKWLNRHEFKRFMPINRCNPDYAKIYYNASFNLSKITVDDKIFGIRLTMETDMPFGYGPSRHAVFECAAGETKKITDSSDEIGFTNVVMTVELKEGGDLIIENETIGVYTVVRNCSAGEKIVFDGVNQIISTSDSSHKIARDFNYEFFKLNNEYNNSVTKFNSSIGCDITIEYDPIIKIAP